MTAPLQVVVRVGPRLGSSSHIARNNLVAEMPWNWPELSLVWSLLLLHPRRRWYVCCVREEAQLDALAMNLYSALASGLDKSGAP
jgi:hypothetical protein